MSRQSRQALYDRIRESSKDEVILEEMVRLGFWPEDEATPSLPAEAIKRQGELTRELRDLLARDRAMGDPARALELMRKERLAASREKRLENKRKRVRERFERSRAWHEQRSKDIVYLGAGVSSGLSERDFDADKLGALGLPIIADAAALADAMGIGISELRFISFARDVSRVSHYRRFTIAKKTGGQRLISTPMPRLKRAQYWVLDNLLMPVPTHDAAHGFVPGRSIVSGARAHLGQQALVNIDLKDFFPSICQRRVFGLFKSFGYSRQVATILALICTEPDVDAVEMDGESLFVARSEGRLPQGAPTSPAISNLICRRLDHRLSGAARSLGFAYTRYADDLSFSCDRNGASNIGKIMWRIRQVVVDEGFIVNESKTRIMRGGRRHEVTGVVVNEKLSIDRHRMRNFRALLRQVELDGPANKHWEGRSDNLLAVMRGFACYVQMVDADKGRPLLARIDRLMDAGGDRSASSPAGPMTRANFRRAAAAARAPRDNWWSPAEVPAPVFEMPRELQPKPPRSRSEQPTGPTDSESAANERANRTGGRRAARHTGLLYRLFEAIVTVMILLFAFRLSPILGGAVLAFVVLRRLFR